MTPRETLWDLTVESLMVKDVLTVTGSQSLADAAQVMVERNVGAAVIWDEGKIRGIITERDLLRALARSLVPWGTPVSDCMTIDPVTVDPGTPARTALREMIKKGFRHLPVMQDGSMVGIVSLRNLVSDFIADLPLEGPELDEHAWRNLADHDEAP